MLGRSFPEIDDIGVLRVGNTNVSFLVKRYCREGLVPSQVVYLYVLEIASSDAGKGPRNAYNTV